MRTNDDLESLIAKSRKESADGSLVTYDLTSGIDFSDPKMVAEALANVFFEKDARNWFRLSGDRVDFVPAYKVRIVLAEDHNKKLGDTVDDFLKDLQKDEISRKYSKQIKDNADTASKLQAVIAVGTLTSMLFRHTEDRIYKDAIKDDLFIDILENLEIRSLNNEDLMDWKRLPL